MAASPGKTSLLPWHQSIAVRRQPDSSRKQRPRVIGFAGKNDESHARDEFGPRGYLRLYVYTGTKIIKFDEASKDKSFKKEEKLGKKASQEQIQARLNMVLNNAGDEAIDDLNFEDVMAKAIRAFAAGGDGSGNAFDAGLAGIVSEQ